MFIDACTIRDGACINLVDAIQKKLNILLNTLQINSVINTLFRGTFNFFNFHPVFLQQAGGSNC